MTFQRLDSVFVFKWDILRWAQEKELVSVSAPDLSREIGYLIGFNSSVLL
jgi:hypothetical protein